MVWDIQRSCYDKYQSSYKANKSQTSHTVHILFHCPTTLFNLGMDKLLAEELRLISKFTEQKIVIFFDPFCNFIEVLANFPCTKAKLGLCKECFIFNICLKMEAVYFIVLTVVAFLNWKLLVLLKHGCFRKCFFSKSKKKEETVRIRGMITIIELN